MAASFKFRNVNLLTGALVIAALAALIAGIVLAGRAQRWFQPNIRLTVRFPSEGTFGVQKGAKVVILGAPAGEVDRITVDDDDRMVGQLKIQAEFARFIRIDSHALVKKTFGIAGDAYIDILVGKGAVVPLADLDQPHELPIDQDTEILAIIEATIDQIREAVLPGLEELERTLAEYRGLAADLRAPDGQLGLTLSNLNVIAVSVQTTLDGLNRGEGTAGRVLRDPALFEQTEAAMKQIHILLEQVQGTLAKVDEIAGHLRETTARLPGMAVQIEGEVKDAAGVVLQTQGTLREAETTLQGLQRHWLLRGSMTPQQPLDPVPADGIGGSVEDRP
jgi:phospholipid/cholesterol/gamma-HCH transport system substrate-binding protein